MIPKVSIILPTYNGSKYIQQSIDSCLNQSFTNFELIVIDDCSSDRTAEIIKSYKDPRIKYYCNQKNQRLPRSLNIGFTKAQGEYLTWTSDDNIFLPNAIQKMVQNLEESKGNFVYTDIYSFKDDDLNRAEVVALEDPQNLPKTNCVRACFMYTRNLQKQIGDYDPDMELIEDYDYWVRVYKKFTMQHIKEPLYYYRYHPQQLYTARNKEIKIIEFLFKLKHGFMPSETVNWHLRTLIEGPTKNSLNKFISFLILKPKIQVILNNYQAGKNNFTETRKALYKILWPTV